MERLSTDEIAIVLQNGESEFIEFKYGTLVLDVISKCICAFANAKGGRIIVGYSDRRKEILGSSAGDRRLIDRAIQQIENPPVIDCYELYYTNKHLLIVDIEPNQHNFSYFKGAIFIRVNDQVQLMNASDIKAAYEKIFNHTLSPYDTIEKMNIQNASLQKQVVTLEDKIDKYHSWEVSADKTSFRWAIFFCLAGSVLGAIIGTVLAKLFV